MALSLEYLGNWLLIAIAILVGVGLIVTFQEDITGAVSGLNPSGDEDEGAQVVNAEGSSAEKAQKVADLVELCNDRSLEKGHENFICFIVRSDGGFNGLSSSTISGEMSSDVSSRTSFENQQYSGETLIIKYSLSEDKVVVTQ